MCIETYPTLRHVVRRLAMEAERLSLPRDAFGIRISAELIGVPTSVLADADLCAIKTFGVVIAALPPAWHFWGIFGQDGSGEHEDANEGR